MTDTFAEQAAAAGRRDPALAVAEEPTLEQFLDYQRATLLAKTTGLTSEQATRTPVLTTSLTIAGLVKHLALVEDSWFQEVLLGRPMPQPWASAPFDDDPDWDFTSAGLDDIEDLRALYRAACERSRAAVGEAGPLDRLSVGESRREPGQHFSLRWILVHLIEETARHNGHADLLREAVDGRTGE